MANRDKKNRDFRDNRESFRNDREPTKKKDKYWRRFKRAQEEQEKRKKKDDEEEGGAMALFI